MARKDNKDRGIFTRTLPSGKTVLGARVYINGREHKFTKSKQYPKGFPSKTAVKHFLQKTHTDIREGKFNPDHHVGKGKLVSEFIDECLELKRGKKSRREDVRFAKFWKEFYRRKRFRDVTVTSLQQARRMLFTNGRFELRSPSTVNRVTNFFRNILNFAEAEDHIVKNPFRLRALKNFPEPESPGVALQDEHERGLYQAIKGHSGRIGLDPMVACLLVRLFILTGFREGTLCGMAWEQTNLEQAKVRLPKLKWGKPVYLAIGTETVAILQVLPSRLRSKWLFPDPKDPKKPLDGQSFFKYVWKHAVKDIGHQTLRIQDLRHTVNTRLIEEGVDLKTTADLMTHSTIKMTERYAHMTTKRHREGAEVLSNRGVSFLNATGTFTGTSDDETLVDHHKLLK